MQDHLKTQIKAFHQLILITIFNLLAYEYIQQYFQLNRIDDENNYFDKNGSEDEIKLDYYSGSYHKLEPILYQDEAIELKSLKKEEGSNEKIDPANLLSNHRNIIIFHDKNTDLDGLLESLKITSRINYEDSVRINVYKSSSFLDDTETNSSESRNVCQSMDLSKIIEIKDFSDDRLHWARKILFKIDSLLEKSDQNNKLNFIFIEHICWLKFFMAISSQNISSNQFEILQKFRDLSKNQFKLILYMRDPRASIIALKDEYGRVTNDFCKPFDNFFEYFISENNYQDDQFLILRYEDFMQDPISFTKNFLKNNGKKIDQDSIQRLNSHSQDLNHIQLLAEAHVSLKP